MASSVYSRQDGGTGRSVTMTSISNTLKETINPRLIFLAKLSVKRKRKGLIGTNFVLLEMLKIFSK
jgi:hypothetical protein